MSRKLEIESQREIDDLASSHSILMNGLIYMNGDMAFVVDASRCRFTVYSDDSLIIFRNISRIVLHSLSEDIGVCMSA